MAVPSSYDAPVARSWCAFRTYDVEYAVPKMEQSYFGERNGVDIIDLEQTVPMLYRAMEAVRDVAGGGRVSFVGTKRRRLSQNLSRCGQYYVNHRWLGGMLTNWKMISNSI